jgi:hypothetical protein
VPRGVTVRTTAQDPSPGYAKMHDGVEISAPFYLYKIRVSEIRCYHVLLIDDLYRHMLEAWYGGKMNLINFIRVKGLATKKAFYP